MTADSPEYRDERIPKEPLEKFLDYMEEATFKWKSNVPPEEAVFYDEDEEELFLVYDKIVDQMHERLENGLKVKHKVESHLESRLGESEIDLESFYRRLEETATDKDVLDVQALNRTAEAYLREMRDWLE